MTLKAILLAGTVVPGLLLSAHPGLAAPADAIVVAQVQPQPDPKKKPPAKPAPAPAAKPVAPPPAAARPAPPPPARQATPPARPTAPPPAAARPTAPQPSVVRPTTTPPAAARPVQQPPSAVRQTTPPAGSTTTPPQQPPATVRQTTPPAGSTTTPSQPPAAVRQTTPPAGSTTTPSQPPAAVRQTTPPAGSTTTPSQPPAAVRQTTPPAGSTTTPSQPPAAVRQTTPPAGSTTTPSQRQAIPPVQRAPAGAPRAPVQQPAVAPLAAPPPAPANARRLDDFRGQRRESRQGSATVIQEPGRNFIRDGGRLVVQSDDSARFRRNSRHVRNVRTEQQGQGLATIIERPNGARIINVTDSSGRLLRRSRRDAGGREVVLIDNQRRGGGGGAFVAGAALGAAVAGLVILNMQSPVVRIPRDRYIVDADRADRALMYETLMAPPVEVLEREYTLDEIRYNAPLRERMRRIDIDTITFELGSWEIGPDQAQRLQVIADVIQQAIQQNPSEIFLIEGHTDATGDDVDNLSLSDRRAEAVAQVLSEEFNVPSENLTTQGYGEQNLKVPTQGPERLNRRVTVRRITPLLNGPVAQQGPPQ